LIYTNNTYHLSWVR